MKTKTSFYLTALLSVCLAHTSSAQCVANLSAGASPNCALSPVPLNATTGGLSYQWFRDGGTVCGGCGPSYVANVAGNYSVMITFSGGCMRMSNPIMVTFLPQAMISPGGSTNCSPSPVPLSANSGPNYSYQWQKDGSNIAGATNLTYSVTATGNYTVAVTSVGCTRVSNALFVSLQPNAIITPAGPTSYCPGGNVQLNANTGTGYAYQWKLNSSNISGATGSSYTAAVEGSYTVTVSAMGCSKTSSPVAVTAVAAATITPGGPTTICQGQNVQLMTMQGQGLTYQWKLNNVNIAGATASSYTASVAGSYTVAVTMTGICTQLSSPVTVVINPNPVATITPSGMVAFCAGNSLLLQASTGPYTYQWRLGTNPISGATSSTYTVLNSGDYSVVVQNSFGCSVQSSTVNVTALSQPIISASGPTNFCAGQAVMLNMISPNPAYTYQWKKNGTAISGATTPGYFANQEGYFTLAVTVSGTGGCTRESVPVQVQFLPVATVVPLNPTTFCQGYSTDLQAIGIGTGLAYQWIDQNGNIPGAAGQHLFVAASGQYSVKITDGGGCNDTSDPVVVAVIQPPGATVTADGPTTYCGSGSVGLHANTGTGLTYQWKVNNVAIGGATNPDLIVTSSGDYRVEVTNSSGCTSISSPITVTLLSQPAATITPAGLTTLCTGGSVQLNANTGSGLTYQWWNGANSISGATSPSYVANTSGSYKVVVTNSLGCSNTSPVMEVMTGAIIAANGAVSFCPGGSVQLSTPNVGTGITHQWFLNGTPVSTNTSITASQDANYILEVNVPGGCTLTSSPLHVYVLASAIITPQGPTTFCPGDNVTLAANTGTGYGYQWTLDGQPFGSGSSTLVASLSGSYVVTVTVPGPQGCSRVSSAVIVTVFAEATATANEPTTFCDGESVQLQANTGTGLIYQWLLGGVDIPGATQSTYTAASQGTYSVRVINPSNVCEGTSDEITVTVNDLPPASITPVGPVAYCSGGSVQLNANTGSGLAYQWKKEGSDIPGQTTSSYLANGSGDFSVVVTNTLGCFLESNVVSVTEFNVATLVANGPTLFCQGNTVQLQANTGAGLTYVWKLGGGIVSGAAGPNYLAAITGSYTVEITASGVGGCTQTSNPIDVSVNAVMPGMISGSQIVCTGGDPAPFAESTPATGSGSLSYEWQSSPNGNIWTPVGGGTLYDVPSGVVQTTIFQRIARSNLNGLVCTLPSNILAVTVNWVSSGAITGSQLICSGTDPAVFAETVPGGGFGTLSYQWEESTDNFSWTPIGGAIGASYDEPDPLFIPTYFRREAKSTHNTVVCSSPSSEVLVSLSTVTGGQISGNQTVCAIEDPAKLVQTVASSGSGTLSYQWQSSQDNSIWSDVGGATSLSYDPPILSTSTWFRRVTNSNYSGLLCTATSNAVLITVEASFIVSIAGQTEFCEGSHTILQAVTNCFACVYQWSDGGSTVFHSVSTGGTYTVAVTKPTSGCFAISNPFVVASVANTNGGFITVSDTCLTTNVQLTANPGGSNKYLWTTGQKTKKITVTSPGNYQVIIVPNNPSLPVKTACYDLFNCFEYVVAFPAENVGVEDGPKPFEEPEISDDLRVYPNPADQLLVIRLSVVSHQKTPIRIVSTMGRISRESELDENQRTLTVDTSDLAPGLYLLHVQGQNGGVKTIKILVVHEQ